MSAAVVQHLADLGAEVLPRNGDAIKFRYRGRVVALSGHLLAIVGVGCLYEIDYQLAKIDREVLQ